MKTALLVILLRVSLLCETLARIGGTDVYGYYLPIIHNKRGNQNLIKERHSTYPYIIHKEEENVQRKEFHYKPGREDGPGGVSMSGQGV